MPDSPLATAHRHLTAAIDELSAAAGTGATDDELLSALTLYEATSRRLDRLTVTTLSDLQRRGTFAERGYTSTAAALGDLLGWERFEARRRVTAAEQVCERVGLDGTPLPARLAATAQVFAAGRTGLRHVEVIAKVLATPAAGRLTPQLWAAAEAQLAAKAADYTPSELHTWGSALVDALDDDGPEPDDQPPAPVNELHLTRHRDKAGGTLKGQFEDAAMFDAIAAVIDAKAKPVTGDDDRSPAAAAGRGPRRRLRVRARPRRRPRMRRPPPAAERADPAGRPAEPGPRRLPRLRRHPARRSRCGCWPATPRSSRS